MPRLGRWTKRLRRWQWRIRGRVADRTTVVTPQGTYTVFTADQVIGRQLFLYREFESDWIRTTLDFLRRTGRLPPRGTGTFLDVGANLGVISVGMLHQGEFARAVAIEPDPRNFSLLEHNARQNGLADDRYRGLPCAASNASGELEFEHSRENFGDHRVRSDAPAGDGSIDRFDESGRATTRVSARPLDDLLAELPRAFTEPMALAWIDTQGHERHVLEGGRRTFARGMPVACEVWPYGLLRAGSSLESFASIVRELWSSYWVWRRDRAFVRYDVSTLPQLFEELGDEGEFENVLFTR